MATTAVPIEVLANGRVREGYSTYPATRIPFPCQSGRSPHCNREARGLYSDGTFGYKGAQHTDARGQRVASPRPGERASVALCAPCFSWEFWNNIAIGDEGADMERAVVVDGVHYRIGSESTGGSRFSGFYGQRFVIEFFDGRHVESTNLWHQGAIPDEFRERMPDNARFVRETRAAALPHTSEPKVQRQAASVLGAEHGEAPVLLREIPSPETP